MRDVPVGRSDAPWRLGLHEGYYVRGLVPLFERKLPVNSVQQRYVCLSLLYVLVMVWIGWGIYATSGSTHLYMMLILFFSFFAASIACYFAFSTRFFSGYLKRTEAVQSVALSNQILVGLCLIGGGGILLHWYLLGGLPILSAFRTVNHTEAGMIRQHIMDAPLGVIYLSSLLVKALIPVALIVLLKGNKRPVLTAVIIFSCWIYALSLMQKSYPIVVLGPAGLWCLLSRRFVSAAGLFSLMLVGVVIGTLAANPEIRPNLGSLGLGSRTSVDRTVQPADTPPKEVAPATAPPIGEIAKDVSTGLSSRVLELPGEVVSKWFSAIPRDLPFEYGCGYRFLAPLLKCQFVDNALLLYKFYYVDLYNRGYRGSMNAAHFAEEYANFGAYGLVLSGVLASLVIALGTVAFARADFAATLALNMPFVLVLGSTALHTTLVSGGWLLVMVLAFLLFHPDRRPVQGRSQACSSVHNKS